MWRAYPRPYQRDLFPPTPSSVHVFVHGGTVSPFAGFPAVAEARGFGPMENTSRWDWNSNDADVCCMNQGLGQGAGQGLPPEAHVR